ncbi:UNVERIFIED_CONTAM: hypothetical protein Sangu_2446500 [Sesamum angustifolium]|uniref:Uncharacterized protein n=1 Tax=Sesamum angustifolium TaxID=2727405 RepID=A0AAW2KYB0_9LAMI
MLTYVLSLSSAIITQLDVSICVQAFHLFHISCLIHWILLCEVEIYAKQLIEPKVKRRSRRKVKGKDGENGEKHGLQEKQIYSAFCQSARELIFKYKIKLCDAQKAWMKSPEVLQNCSVGLDFPPHTDDVYQDNAAPEIAKLLSPPIRSRSLSD